MQATVSIATVYPPGPGKTNWAIIGGDGVRYSVPPKFSNLLAQGQSVALDYQVKQFNGKEARMVDTVHVMGNGQQQSQAQPPQQQAPSPPPRANGNGSATPFDQAETRKAENIFICGVVNSAITHQSYPLDEGSLALLINAARTAWRAPF